jgi:PAS domain S-box-containing protein
MDESQLENRYRIAFDTAPLAIALADPEKRMLEANPSFLQMFGYPAPELQRLRLEDLIHPEGRREFELRVRSVMEGATDKFKTDTRCAARDGRSFWVSVSATAMRGADGRIRYWLWLLEDISERVQTEEEHRRLTAQVRTVQPAGAIGTLASGIAHDFNNLLMGIEGNLSLLLLDKPPGHKDVSYLKNIEKSVERAAELTRQIIEMVRSEKGRGAASSVFLPAASDGVACEPEPAETAGHPLKGILLVEDEEIVATIGEKMLTRLGYRVHVARGGNEAIELYVQRRSEIELVILDMVMPGMAGGEVFDRLRSINPQAAVLLSSGYSLNGQAMEILKRGCRGFIQKPFSIEQLKQKISEILEGR